MCTMRNAAADDGADIHAPPPLQVMSGLHCSISNLNAKPRIGQGSDSLGWESETSRLKLVMCGIKGSRFSTDIVGKQLRS